MNATSQILERVGHAGPLDVDDAQGVVKGVRVLGLESANGRTYLREGVRQAIGLYEGVQVNADHPARPGDPVSIDRRIGWLESVRQEADGGLRGDLHLLLSDPRTPKILEVAKRRPSLLGLSHNASGRTRREGGREVVEAIEAVHSVDLVADPATVSGLHESRTQPVAKAKVRALIEQLQAKRPGWAKALREMAEAGIMSPDAEMAPPAEAAASDGDHAEALKAGFKAAIHAVVDDDGMDMATKLAKIKEILKAQEKLMSGGDSGGSESGGGSEPGNAEEGRRRAAGNLQEQRLALENKALRLLAGKGLKLTPLVERAIKGCSTEAEVVELVDSLGREAPAGGARSAAPWQPSAGTNGSGQLQEARVPENADGAALGRWLKAPG